VASRLRRAADEAKRKRDEEKKKLLAARAEEKKKAEEAEGPSTPAGKKAEESGDPDEVLVAAQSAYDEKRYAKAVRLYQKLAKLAPDSEYSRLADTRIKELEGDPAVKRSMADAESERRARPFLTLARNFRRSGDAAKAATYYKKVIEQFPGTSFADEASDEMKTLEGKK